MNKISVNMLVGKANEPYLEYALKGVAWADEFIVVESTKGQNDRNLEIVNNFFNNEARLKNCKLINYYEYYDEFNFANAREIARINTDTDYFLKCDADECYEDTAEQIIRSAIQETRLDIGRVCFYHMMFDIYNYQDYICGKEVLFRTNNNPWNGFVHEGISQEGKVVVDLDTYFLHFGYTLPQKDIWNKWRLYAELGDGTPGMYDNRNPDTILDDRISVIKSFTGLYPDYFPYSNYKKIVKQREDGSLYLDYEG